MKFIIRYDANNVRTRVTKLTLQSAQNGESLNVQISYNLLNGNSNFEFKGKR